MLRKKVSIIMVIIVLAFFLLSSVVMAATPNNTIFFGNKAYDLNLMNDQSLVTEILAAFLANGNKFIYKTPGGLYIDADATAVDPATIPAGTYKDANKNEIAYNAGDTEPEDVGNYVFEVISIE